MVTLRSKIQVENQAQPAARTILSTAWRELRAAGGGAQLQERADLCVRLEELLKGDWVWADFVRLSEITSD